MTAPHAGEVVPEKQAVKGDVAETTGSLEETSGRFTVQEVAGTMETLG